MIFVTVGTHEQQFNRLIQYIDELRGYDYITEDVIIQTGYCSYEPKYCKWSKIIPYKEMIRNVAEARIVITHGGPSSFIMPLQVEKIPIVVPRQKQFDEHVNNHQVDFVKAVCERQGNIIPIYEIENLRDKIVNYERIIASMQKEVINNNAKFNEELMRIVDKLFAGTDVVIHRRSEHELRN
ncbi:MAG: putative glycosyltransferase [Clostridiaceae bacterium]|jgi:UDP-N-acetylglucosamine transferase subunit ALG13|nr:putative glycosyltransferase [Clostridiaceae bacterium]